MKKSLHSILVLIFFLLIAASLCLQFHSCAQKRLNAEMDLLSNRIAGIHELIGQQKALREEALSGTGDLEKVQSVGKKIHEMDLRLEENLQSVGKAISESPSPVARLTVIPKYAELLYVTNHRIEAGECWSAGLKMLEPLKDPQIKASLYVGFAESALRCRDFEGYEKCKKLAEESAKLVNDTQWNAEMLKTFENLALLNAECQKTPRNFLPVLKESAESENPTAPSTSQAPAASEPLPASTPAADLELGETASEMPMTLEALTESAPESAPAPESAHAPEPVSENPTTK